MNEDPADNSITIATQEPSASTAHSDNAYGHNRRAAFVVNDRVDVVLADPSTVEDLDDLEEVATSLGATLVLRQVRTGDGLCHHDPLRLAAAFRDAFDGVMGDVGEPRAR